VTTANFLPGGIGKEAFSSPKVEAYFSLAAKTSLKN